MRARDPRNDVVGESHPPAGADVVQDRDRAVVQRGITPHQEGAAPVLRDVVRETRLDAADFVYPMFVEAGLEGRAPVGAMPGIDRLSISQAVAEAGEAAALGLPGVLLFGIPAEHISPRMT